MSTSSTLLEFVAPIEPDLLAMGEALAQELVTDDPSVAEMVEHLSRFQGKQLRASLLLLVARASGNSSPEMPVVAAVVELIHLATLVHDDVLDGAEIRRRLPSLNTTWDNQIAVLLGDWLYSRAFARSTRLTHPLASQVLATTTQAICVGEIRQALGRHRFDASPAEYERIAMAKTGVLYGAAAELGVCYGRVDQEVLGREMRLMGQELGLAFQIADDLLDIEGEEAVVGKSVGTDIADGKVTLPVLHAWRSADSVGRAAIEAAYLDTDCADRRRALREACDLAKGCEQARARADELIASAQSRLLHLPANEMRLSIERVLEFTLERRS